MYANTCGDSHRFTADVQKAEMCTNVHKHGLLTGGAVIELSQFHLANEGEGSSLPFRMLQANNHIETRGDVARAGWGHIM